MEGSGEGLQWDSETQKWKGQNETEDQCQVALLRTSFGFGSYTNPPEVFPLTDSEGKAACFYSVWTCYGFLSPTTHRTHHGMFLKPEQKGREEELCPPIFECPASFSYSLNSEMTHKHHRDQNKILDRLLATTLHRTSSTSPKWNSVRPLKGHWNHASLEFCIQMENWESKQNRTNRELCVPIQLNWWDHERYEHKGLQEAQGLLVRCWYSADSRRRAVVFMPHMSPSWINTAWECPRLRFVLAKSSCVRYVRQTE